jgi:hypothetical protein
MLDSHVQGRELRRLFGYIANVNDKSPGPSQFSDDRKVMLLTELLEMERIALSTHYEASSPFGRTPEQICATARAHVTSCGPCYDGYMDFIRDRARRDIKIYNGIAAKVGCEPISGEEIDWRYIIGADFLKVLS